MELLTGFGLATAAGLNAYIPLLALGLLSRFTDLVTLPHGWAWLENGWVMTIVAALLAVEIVADKIPALDWGYLSWSSWRSWCRCSCWWPWSRWYGRCCGLFVGADARPPRRRALRSRRPYRPRPHPRR